MKGIENMTKALLEEVIPILEEKCESAKKELDLAKKCLNAKCDTITIPCYVEAADDYSEYPLYIPPPTFVIPKRNYGTWGAC